MFKVSHPYFVVTYFTISCCLWFCPDGLHTHKLLSHSTGLPPYPLNASNEWVKNLIWSFEANPKTVGQSQSHWPLIPPLISNLIFKVIRFSRRHQGKGLKCFGMPQSLPVGVFQTFHGYFFSPSALFPAGLNSLFCSLAVLNSLKSTRVHWCPF